MVAPAFPSTPAAPDRSNPSQINNRLDNLAISLGGVPGQWRLIQTYLETLVATKTPKWAAGAYSENDPVYSPTDYLTYRAKADIASSLTDPSSDPTNWQLTLGMLPSDKAKLDLLTVPSAVDLNSLRRGKFRTADGSGSAGDVVARQSDGTIKVVTTGNANADDWLGFAAADFVDAASVRILGYGDIVTGLTGLTYGETYYLDGDGSLTISAVGGRKVGLALSTTALLITEING
jgi:hypothetical protein